MRKLCFKTALLLSLFANLSFAQPGCPDPQATNFNPNATQNDGSCLYPITTYAPIFSANLDSDLREISGLHRSNGEWWAHNDSGSDPAFFSINPENGAILKKIELMNAQNRDWEDICADGQNLYIGDFGNNNNDRQNLGIYKVPLNAIGSGSNQTVSDSEYSFVPYQYPDQTDFSTTAEDSTVFDCESIIYTENKLHLFTKNWKEYQTSHYAIDPLNGAIEKIETFDADGLITAASISPDGKLIVLTGYDLRGLPTVFCWLLWDWPSGTDLFFSGNKRRIELGSAFSIGQVESIGFEGNRSGYIANERTEYGGVLFVPQRTWKVDFGDWVPESVATKSPVLEEARLNYYPNPCRGTLYFEANYPDNSLVKLQVINKLGVVKSTIHGIPNEIDLGNLPRGLYTIRVVWPDDLESIHKLIRG